MRVFP